MGEYMTGRFGGDAGLATAIHDAMYEVIIDHSSLYHPDDVQRFNEWLIANEDTDGFCDMDFEEIVDVASRWRASNSAKVFA